MQEKTHMHGMRKAVVVAVLAAGVLAMAGSAHAQKTIKMLYTAVNGFASAYVAQDEGFFHKHGFDVEFSLTQSAGNHPAALVSDSVQIAGPTMTTLLQANDAGLDLVVFAGGAVYPLDGDILVARVGSDIKKTTDLKGKRIGVPGIGALLHVMLVRNLKLNGVDPNTVKFVEVAFPQAADALKSGTIDAYPAVAPFSARIVQSGAGYEVVDWLKETPDGTLTIIYAATRKWATANRDVIEGFKAGMAEANVFVKSHHDAEVKAVAHYTKLPEKIIDPLAAPNLIVDVTPAQIKFWIDISKEQGLIKGNPDPASIIFK
jgi:NitT/TauT family transport system substrate-binding protein